MSSVSSADLRTSTTVAAALHREIKAEYFFKAAQILDEIRDKPSLAAEVTEHHVQPIAAHVHSTYSKAITNRCPNNQDRLIRLKELFSGVIKLAVQHPGPLKGISSPQIRLMGDTLVESFGGTTDAGTRKTSFGDFCMIAAALRDNQKNVLAFHFAGSVTNMMKAVMQPSNDAGEIDKRYHILRDAVSGNAAMENALADAGYYPILGAPSAPGAGTKRVTSFGGLPAMRFE